MVKGNVEKYALSCSLGVHGLSATADPASNFRNAMFPEILTRSL